MTDKPSTLIIHPDMQAIVIVTAGEALVLYDRDGASAIEFTNPIVAASMTARLRAWADLIERRTTTNPEGRTQP